MKYYAIKHKPTGQCMPQMVFKASGGWSSWTPGALGNTNPAPRLFCERASAVRAAAAWAAGSWSADMETYSSFDEPEYSYRGTPYPTKVDGRRFEDLEIVEVEMDL